MDTNSTKPENEFKFIQEKVIPRRKNKIKKILLMIIGTICLATIFGFVARIVFIKSEGFINKLLGIDTTQRAEILFPSEPPEDLGEITQTPGQSNQNLANVTPENTPVVTPMVTPNITIEPTPSIAQEPTVIEQKIPATISDYERILLDIKKVASSVNNSLVTITAIENKEDWADEPFESKKTATGIILGENSAELMILTDYSMVKEANEIEITFSSGVVVRGELWNYDKDYNLAVIAIKLKDITPTQLSVIKTADLGESYSLTVGSAIIGLGQPNGNANSMEVGMITGKGNSYYIMDNRLDLFTTDITNTIDSNGVIVSMDGKIVGIITQILKDESETSISTAVGISRLKSVIEKLTNKYDRILLGVTGQDIPTSVLESYELEAGIYVTKVLQDSPAFNGDIRQGDIITGINDYTVASIINFNSILNNYKPGETIKVSVARQSKGELKEVKLSVTLSKK